MTTQLAIAVLRWLVGRFGQAILEASVGSLLNRLVSEPIGEVADDTADAPYAWDDPQELDSDFYFDGGSRKCRPFE